MVAVKITIRGNLLLNTKRTILERPFRRRVLADLQTLGVQVTRKKSTGILLYNFSKSGGKVTYTNTHTDDPASRTPIVKKFKDQVVN